MRKTKQFKADPDRSEMDATRELVRAVPYGEYPQATSAEESTSIRSIDILKDVPYEELTEDEKKYLVTGLITKNNELDKLTKRVFTELDRQKELRKKELDFIADSLTFIKTEVGQCFGSVNLAIKNIEREVKENGNKF